MSRQRTGTLVLYKGVYHTQATVGPRGSTRRELYSLGTSDKTLALRRRARLMQDLDAKKPLTEKGLAAAVPAPPVVPLDWSTFKEYAEDWIQEREDDGVVMAPDEANNLRRYVYPTIGRKPLRDGGVTPADIKEMLKLAAAAGLARETVRKIRAVASRVFNAAVEDGKITDNPVTKTLLKRRRRDGKNAAPAQVVKRRAILTDEEIATYMAFTKVDPELQLMSLAARVEGGMRTGDLNRWDWSHITTQSFATCVVPRSKADEPQVLEIPEVLRGRLRARWEAAGKPESGPIFPVRRGPNKGGFRAKRGISFAARLRRDLKKAGLTRHELFHETATSLPVDFHSFRRAFNTALATAGVNVQTAMRLAGHADERTHMRYVMDAPEMRRIPEAAIPKMPAFPAPRTPAVGPATLPEAAPVVPIPTPRIATTVCDSISEIDENPRAPRKIRTCDLRLRRPDSSPALPQPADQDGASSPVDLGVIFTRLIRIAGQQSQRIATTPPDPVEVLRALADGRGAWAREEGRALAMSVLAAHLTAPAVALALAALERGPEADHRLIDLCELLARAEGAGEQARSGTG